MGLLSWGMATFYDLVMRRTEATCLGQWRQELLQSLAGEVLEIGAGTGVNLDSYPDTVTRLVLSEPDRHMRNRIKRKLAVIPIDHDVIAAPAEALPFPDQSFDAVVATLVLCSVEHPEESLAELHRVLKPGGKLALIEHVGASSHTTLYQWQKRIEPFWKKCVGNCHLTRDTLAALQAGRFDCKNLQQDHMRGAVALVAPIIRGIAKKT